MRNDKIFRQFETSLWTLSRKTEQLWNHIFQENFPGSQSKIIFILQENGPMKMSEIADALRLTAGAVTTSANHLIARGHVERVTSENDRRVIKLKITKTGMQAFKILENQGHEQLKAIFNHLEADDFIYIEKLFSKAIVEFNQLEEKN